MYGKIFDSIYNGTLYGQWEALVTFQQMIVLADADGIVDMTPQAIAARTSIPMEIIQKGIAILSGPDPDSRTPGEEGRRIVLIDSHRSWGWSLVNYEKYKHLQDSDTIREQNRLRVRRHREKRKAEKRGVTNVTDGNAQKRHIDIDIDKRKDTVPSGRFVEFWKSYPTTPRKGSKSKCAEIWSRRKLDDHADLILRHIEFLKASEDWTKDGGAYIPAPAVYLNQSRWDGAEFGSAPASTLRMVAL